MKKKVTQKKEDVNDTPSPYSQDLTNFTIDDVRSAFNLGLVRGCWASFYAIDSEQRESVGHVIEGLYKMFNTHEKLKELSQSQLTHFLILVDELLKSKSDKKSVKSTGKKKTK